MSIKFYLRDNVLTPDPNDYRAVVQPNGVKTIDDVIEEASKRGTLVTKTDMVAVTNLLFEILTDFVAEGFAVNTPVVNMRPGIKGVFIGAGAGFNSKDHTVNANISVGLLLRSKMEAASVTKIQPNESKPVLIELFDNGSQSNTSLLTPGGIATLVGTKLKIETTNTPEGIFLIDSAGVETKVLNIIENKPGKVIFAVPNGLTPGKYTIILRNSGSNPNNIRTGQLADLIEVL